MDKIIIKFFKSLFPDKSLLKINIMIDNLSDEDKQRIMEAEKYLDAKRHFTGNAKLEDVMEYLVDIKLK